MPTQNHSTLTGAAGECYVMYRLLRMGYIAALAPKGVPNADIIVTDVEGELAAAVQVKTKSKKNANGGWQMKAKHEKLKSENLYYCFVNDTVSPPDIYIIPNTIVASTIKEAHQIWLSTLGRGGREHKANDIRWLLPDYNKNLHVDNEFTRKHSLSWLDKYKENWSILGLDKKA